MWITKVSINNPVFATMVMVGLCVLGLFAYARLGVEQLPDITSPTLTISVFYPGASPEAVENDITKPIENAVNTVGGIKTIYSNSYEADSEVYVQFKLGTDINRAIQDVRDRVGQIRPGFPREAKDPLILRENADTDQPIALLSVSSSTRTPRELTSLTEQVIIKELQHAAGVGRITYGGGQPRQILIHIHPEALAAYGVGVNQVMDAIRTSNQDIAVGRISDSKTEALVRVEGRLKDLQGFRRVVVTRRGSAGVDVPVYLDQVADVEDAEEEPQTMARLNGVPAISMAVFKVQDANIVDTGEGVKAAVEALQKRLPEGVDLKVVNATSDFVRDSLRGVRHTLIEGALLTVLIVFLFLHSWRSTVITGLTLPIAVISTFIALYAFGFTLNFMTMMALSLCIGLLIDDAIVVRENIVRHLRMGKGHFRAALEGTQEIGLAVMATTFAIVAVFVPVAFMGGIAGKFFYSFGVTVTVAVLVSLFVSFTLDPMLSSLWFDPPRSRIFRFKPLAWLMDGIDRGLERIHVIYGASLTWALQNRLATLLLALALFLFSLPLTLLTGTEFIPQVDDSWISLRLTTPIGASLEYADSKTREVENELKTIPAIVSTDVNVYGDGRGTVRVNLTLTPPSERSQTQKELEKEIREKLSHIPGIQVSIGYQTPIWLNVLGPDSQKINEIAAALVTKIAKVPGIVDLETSMKAGTPALSVRPNPDLASDLGLTNEAIGNALQPLVGGETVSYWLGPDGQNYAVRVQMPKSDRSAANEIGDLMLATGRTNAAGVAQLVPLRQVATIVPTESPKVIKRQDLQRRVGIYANVQGRPAGDAGSDVKRIIEETTVPAGYRVAMAGEQQDQADTVSAMLAALVLAVIFIYLVLASQFGSFLQPLAIMMSLPFSLVGVLLALVLTHTTLNLFSMIGFVMLMGLVTKNAILLVDFANQAQRAGKSQFQALYDAGQVRLRPILMTTGAMVFGMLPLALGWGGQGAEQQAPMGRAIIGGVLSSTLLTLVVVPAAYSYVDVWGRRVRDRFIARSRARQEEAQSAGDGSAAAAPLGQPAAPRRDESGV